MNRLRVGLLVLIGFTMSARADQLDEMAATRVEMAKKLINPELNDAPWTFAAFDEVCGQDCAWFGYGGCVSNQGVVSCRAKIFDVNGKVPKPGPSFTISDGKLATKVDGARQGLVAKLTDVGEHPLWLEEHKLEMPAKDITKYNLTFRWDWKKLELTVLDGKKVVSKTKAGALSKGLGLTSAAIWFNVLDGGGGAGNAILRTVGEDDQGHAGDAVVMIHVPYAGPNQ